MPASESQKRLTRKRIVDAAADWFRDRGYRGATIDDIMGAADLTRGTFYAHFASKEELFAEVVVTNHDLLRRLRDRKASTKSELLQQGKDILCDYIDVSNHDMVGPNCTLSTLTADIARTNQDTRTEFALLLNSFASEIARGHEQKPTCSFAALSMLVGGVLLAHGCRGTPTQREILQECQVEIDNLLVGSQRS